MLPTLVHLLHCEPLQTALHLPSLLLTPEFTCEFTYQGGQERASDPLEAGVRVGYESSDASAGSGTQIFFLQDPQVFLTIKLRDGDLKIMLCSSVEVRV